MNYYDRVKIIILVQGGVQVTLTLILLVLSNRQSAFKNPYQKNL